MSATLDEAFTKMLEVLIGESVFGGAMEGLNADGCDVVLLPSLTVCENGCQEFPAFWLLANTGMRRNEVLGLQWDDIDTDAGTVSINRGVVDVGYEVQQTRGKTRNSRRLVTLDETTLQLLGSWRDWRTAEAEAVGSQASDWVFADHKGEPIHPQSLSQAFERIMNRTDVPVIRLHDLRHTHATLLIKEGVPVKVVSERLGHASPAFTLTTYQHVLPGMQAEAATTFRELIRRKRAKVTGPTKAQVEAVEDPVEGREKSA